MAQTRTGEIDFDLKELTVIGATALKGALTASSTVTVSGALTANSLTLVQTLGGTDATAKWATAGTPALTTGMSYFTFTSGASTFRVPCWQTT